nr:hypothetical protein [Tanacetum cinerariifolium]
MAGRSTRSNTANNTNPPNETTNEVTRQLNTALPNLLAQLVEALRGNRANQRDTTQSFNYKTFSSCGANKFFGIEGAVGLLTWFTYYMANRLTTDGIKDGIFKKKENAKDKKRSNNQFKTKAGMIGTRDKGLERICYNCFRTRTRGNRPNPMLAIKGNHNQRNNRNHARGRAFAIGAAEAPHDPNIVTGTFSLNNHYDIVLLILVLIIALSLPTSCH